MPNPKIVIIRSKVENTDKEMKEALVYFEQKGCEIIFPPNVRKSVAQGNQNEREEIENPKTVFDKIRDCDLVYLLNPGGHTDNKSILQMEFASTLKKPIFALVQPKDSNIPSVKGWLYDRV